MRWKDELITANGFIQNQRWNKLKKIPLRHFLFYVLPFSKLKSKRSKKVGCCAKSCLLTERL